MTDLLKLPLIIHLLISILIFICILSEANPQTDGNDLLSKTKSSIKRITTDQTTEVPVSLIREYGMYFLDDQGFGTNQLVCELDGSNLSEKFSQYSVEYTSLALKTMISLRTIGLITYEYFSDLFDRMNGIVASNSDTDIFMGVSAQLEITGRFKESCSTYYKYLEMLSSKINVLLNSIDVTHKQLMNNNNLSSGNGLFCKYMYSAMFSALEQNLSILKAVLHLLSSLSPELHRNNAGNGYKELFSTLTDDKEYLSGSFILDTVSKIQDHLYYCVGKLSVFEIPESLSSLKEEVNQNQSDALIFGNMINAIANEGNFVINACKDKINKLLKDVSNINGYFVNKISKVSIVIHSLKNKLGKSNKVNSKYKLFMNHKRNINSSGNLQLNNDLNSVIEASELENITYFLYELLSLFRLSLREIKDSVNEKTRNHTKSVFNSKDKRFTLSIFNKNYDLMVRFQELDELVDYSIGFYSTAKQSENKLIKLLSFAPFAQLLIDLKPQERSKVDSLAKGMNEYVANKRLEKYFPYDSSIYEIEQSIREFVSTLISNAKSLETKCEELRKYYESTGKGDIESAIDLIDNSVIDHISDYNGKNALYKENTNSLTTLLGLNFLVKHDYSGISALISTLLNGSTYLGRYIEDYMLIKSCFDNKVNKNLMLNDDIILEARTTPRYSDITDYIRNSDRFEKEIKAFNLLQNLKEATEYSSMINSILGTHLLAQIYLLGPVSHVTSGNLDAKLTIDHFHFIYESIFTNGNKFFSDKGVTVSFIDRGNPDERLHLLHTIFSSYRKMVDSLSMFALEKEYEYDSKGNSDGNVKGFDIANMFKMAVSSLFHSLKEMFHSGFYGKGVDSVALECVHSINIIAPEYVNLFTRMYDNSFTTGRLASIIKKSDIVKFVDMFLKHSGDRSFYRSNAAPVPPQINDRVFLSELQKSDYPGSIRINKKNILPLKSESNCRVAFVDSDDDLHVEDDDSNSSKVPIGKYNLVTIHCIIQNSPGSTLPDFLNRRSSIKSGHNLEIEAHVIDILADVVYVQYLAVDHKLANSIAYIDDIEMSINPYFMIVPGLSIDYVLNLDVLLFSSELRHFYFFKDIINYCLDMYLSFDSADLSISRSFLAESVYMSLIYTTSISGVVNKLLPAGKYSGFGGETPLLLSFVKKEEYNAVDDLNEISRDLFQDGILNCAVVYRNMAPLKRSSTLAREYVWFLTEMSNISYMMLLRNELLNDGISGKQNRALYAASLDAANQEQISHMNPFFNSIIREKSTNMFYDVNKHKVMFLVDYNLDISKKALEQLASIKTSIHKNFFENINARRTEIFNVPIFQVDVLRAIDSLVIGSMPLYCSSRRNYFDNSIVVSLTDRFSLKNMISYRVLLRTLDSSLGLRVRNLPSQSGLRKIFNMKPEYVLDIQHMKYKYTLPITDLSDSQAVSEIQNMLAESIAISSSYSFSSSLLAFVPEISLSSVGLRIVHPSANNRLQINQGSQLYTLNGITYYLIKYNSGNFLSSLDEYLREFLLGRTNILFVRETIEQREYVKYLPEGRLLIHAIKEVPIELVGREHVIKIYVDTYDNWDTELIYKIMKIYKYYDVSIVAKDAEYYYFYKLCFDESDLERNCTFVYLLRYLQTNLFEALTHYQVALNNNLYLVAIAEEGEIVSQDIIGLNVLTRFGGSVLFRSQNLLELHYSSNQYWDACLFVKEYYKFSTELQIMMVNHDPNIEDIIIESSTVDCPSPPIPILARRGSLLHFVRLGDSSGVTYNEVNYILTLHPSLNYQVLASYIDYYLAGHNVGIQPEGLDSIIQSKKLEDILTLFSVTIDKDNTGNNVITLNNISLKSIELESAKKVSEKLKTIYPGSKVVTLTTRNELIDL